MSAKAVKKVIVKKINDVIAGLETAVYDLSAMDLSDESDRSALIDQLMISNDAIVEIMGKIEQDDFVDDDSSELDDTYESDDDQDEDEVEELDAELTFETDYPDDDDE